MFAPGMGFIEGFPEMFHRGNQFMRYALLPRLVGTLQASTFSHPPGVCRCGEV
jgi:hypothetical protein